MRIMGGAFREAKYEKLWRRKKSGESEGGQKFLPPTPFLFARPSVQVLGAKRAIIQSFAQKMFELRPKNTAKFYIQRN